jgi:hypothetical protein
VFSASSKTFNGLPGWVFEITAEMPQRSASTFHLAVVIEGEQHDRRVRELRLLPD